MASRGPGAPVWAWGRLPAMTRSQFLRLFPFLGWLLMGSRCARGQLSPAARELQRDELRFLIREGTAWVKAERNHYRPSAAPLTGKEKRRFAGFFPPELLAAARVKVVSAIRNPDFYAAYEELGKRYPLNLENAVGFAVVDTVLIARSHGGRGTEARVSLLFHELVHLTQYQVLGVDAQLERYIRALAEGGFRYRANPFEVQAFELQRRFDRRPQAVFSVEDEVRRRFVDGAAPPG